MGKWLLVALSGVIFFAAAPAAKGDEKVNVLLKEVEAATQKAQTLTADLVMVDRNSKRETRYVGTVKLKKPNLARIELRQVGGTFARTIASDGKTLWVVTMPRNEYTKGPIEADGRNIGIWWADVIGYFFDVKRFIDLVTDPTAVSRYAGVETIDGAEFTVIETTSEDKTHRIKFHIGADKLVHHETSEVRQDDVSGTLEATLKDVRVNVPLTEADFAYKPPPTAKLVEPQPFNFEAQLLPVGKEVPDFNLPTPRGGTLSLSDVRKGKKAVLINFWFYN